jgi:amino acid transporter
MQKRPAAPGFVPARLGLWDAVSIIVGIIVGAGIYQSPADVFASVPGPVAALGVWLLGGVLSLLGALCYAELASAYPYSGGEFVYLSRALGRGVGFLFAWAQLAVIRPGGGMAAPAYVCARTADDLFHFGEAARVGVAVAVIAVLTVINALGTDPGKWAQNGLTAAKVLSLAGIIAAGLLLARPEPASAPLTPPRWESFAVAMVFVLYAFEGWNEAAYVAAEVRQARRNIPLALILGTAGVTVIYLLVNLAYLAGLGFAGASAKDVGADKLLTRALGTSGAVVVSACILIAVLGSINGTILTGARLFAELGTTHRVFAPLAWWDRRGRAPVGALAAQGLIGIAMVVAVDVSGGSDGGFERVVGGTAPVFWLFLFLTGVSLFVLRFRDRAAVRPFRVPYYPLTPLLFCGWSGYMFVATAMSHRGEAHVALAILAAGLPLYFLSRRLAGPAAPVSEDKEAR